MAREKPIPRKLTQRWSETIGLLWVLLGNALMLGILWLGWLAWERLSGMDVHPVALMLGGVFLLFCWTMVSDIKREREQETDGDDRE